ncbi:MAG: hypothetical protein JRN09_05760 [Nitrososphaerota archaeon]|jgi:hypothetical protein|nr:hypothetical protein [Nitrososphaerota archaeon]
MRAFKNSIKDKRTDQGFLLVTCNAPGTGYTPSPSLVGPNSAQETGAELQES